MIAAHLRPAASAVLATNERHASLPRSEMHHGPIGVSLIDLVIPLCNLVVIPCAWRARGAAGMHDADRGGGAGALALPSS